MSDGTPISPFQRVQALNEAERAVLRDLGEGPGMATEGYGRAAEHLSYLGLIEQFAPQGWLAITPMGRQALKWLEPEAAGPSSRSPKGEGHE